MFLNYIGEQMYRSGLQHDLVLIDTLDDIDTVYDQADILFVSSRLDPLPNVAIDMALKGKPVLCFDKATGFAEVVSRKPETSPLAVPYLDTAMAAEVMVDLAAASRDAEGDGHCAARDGARDVRHAALCARTGGAWPRRSRTAPARRG